MALFGLFGDDEPRVVLVQNPNNDRYGEGYDPKKKYIRVRMDSEGNIVDRSYADDMEGFEMLNEGEAVEASPRDLEKLRSGEIKIGEIQNLFQRSGEEEAERRDPSEMEREMRQRSDKSSPLSGERRRSRIDRAEEQAVNPNRDNNGGNY